ncbi:Elongation factor Tu GTP-binding domain-containing protein 1 [Thelohanellus kitauei]|uniref:Elongation factor Tu GTP-binding domain-containing protein 1 n=1 Tax=Thelohanellus kitauei TaxID=669202 RepID=A0A0C2NKL0_THEKT|nr:Elongation factor Tu GTP-binding domain-containing protein 1 [Thelohanellus kitauei]
MDYKEEEHKNGVTMKSAGISLNYWHKNLKYLINVVDTPGHIDFSFEVSCAVRICDGAVVLIDVVEGVCPQTEVVLRQSWKEGIVPCLAINKIDRLVHELRMTPMEAYIHISNVVDQANALMFNLYQETGQQSSDGCQYDVYFSPVKGNVIFCSGLNGWAFR